MCSSPMIEFAVLQKHQLKHLNNDFEVELSPGLFAGQKLIPVNSVGCYVPGGRKIILLLLS